MSDESSSNLLAPFILTLELDPESTSFFNDLRVVHFPPARNFLVAHLTLFHKLPNSEEVKNVVHHSCGEVKPFLMLVDGLLKLGRGVAYSILSSELQQLHRKFRERWADHLSRQDLQPFRPHLTVQNKVSLQERDTLYNELSRNFKPFYVTAIALTLHEYHNGPWQKVSSCDFRLMM
jgi:hypothetical protein